MNKNMYEEIMRIVYDYAINNKPVDRDFLYKIVDIIVMSKSLNDYARGIKIDEESNPTDTIATYNHINRILSIYWQELLDYANITLKSGWLSSIEGRIDLYKTISGIILHELVHAGQEKEKNEKRGTIKSRILELSCSYIEDESKMKYMMPDEKEEYKDYLDSLYKRYEEYHDYAPHEREAHIEEFTLNAIITSELNKKLSGLDNLQYVDFRLLEKHFFFGYDEGLVPANYYFEQLGLKNEWGLLVPQTKILTPEEKVIYGLEMPITEVKEEYHKLVRERIR